MSETKIDRDALVRRISYRDLHRAARSLASRGDQLLARKDRDPILRAAAETEAAFCRRFAAMIVAIVREVK